MWLCLCGGVCFKWSTTVTMHPCTDKVECPRMQQECHHRLQRASRPGQRRYVAYGAAVSSGLTAGS